MFNVSVGSQTGVGLLFTSVCDICARATRFTLMRTLAKRDAAFLSVLISSPALRKPSANSPALYPAQTCGLEVISGLTFGGVAPDVDSCSFH